MRRRQWLCSPALGLGLGSMDAAAAAAPDKTLRIAFKAAETGFDPARISDGYSRAVTAHIFEALYDYDPLARPVRIRPLTAAALPEVRDNFRHYTIELRRGIFFTPDPAFGGRARELVAADYVYSFKRLMDPALRSPMMPFVQTAGMLGLDALREEALRSGHFDYEREIPGLRATGRYTLEIRLAQPRPRLIERLAGNDIFGAVAHEVVQHWGEAIDAHPVGTGPFVLARWSRGSRILLQRNPHYRERYLDAQAASDDAEGQALARQLQGRRLPLLDAVDIRIIEENQPRWLAFLKGELDLLGPPGDGIPADFISQAVQHGELSAPLRAQGLQLKRQLNADSELIFFTMSHPVVGGLQPERVALRRAISLGMDVPRHLALVRKGQGVPAHSPLVPHTSGYDPHFKSEMGQFDPARARALLDAWGWRDRDGDGWREQPDGRPLVLEVATTPTQSARQTDELWRINMKRIGLNVRFKTANFGDHLKAARAGQLMIWGFSVSSDVPDGLAALARYHGPQAGSQNVARVALPELDALYEQLQALPDGPQRNALFHEAKRLAVAWVPYKIVSHSVSNDLAQPWVRGFRRPLFGSDYWQYLDMVPRA
ncbi:ABC transporter substrate-binding protein [Roseateles sp. BYS180W]|uniref:ABC transporter substrate-binding protein n=1 Tax=Roseateles rivi TaxID=3299028 RepID=A0ABW7FZD0_9BURK